LAELDDNSNGKTSRKEGPVKPKPAGYFEGESMTRRHVFEVGVQAVGGVAVLAILLPVVGFAFAPVFDAAEISWEGVGSPDDYGPDTYRQAVITIRDGIGEAGKTTVYIRRGNPEVFEQESADEFVAISTRCAHLGCPVRFVRAAGNFICPCHGGVYGFQGQVIGGPPVRPLDRFQTRVTGDTLEIGPRYSVTNDLEPVRARDPGEFTGGIWEYLYPPRPTTAAPPEQ
jgi:Rieske Fe-S protein